MVARHLFEVTPVGEARTQLTQLLARFEAEGQHATPMVFGRHRRPEAAVIPYELFTQMLELYEEQLSQREFVQRHRERLDEVPAEDMIRLSSPEEVNGLIEDVIAEADETASRA